MLRKSVFVMASLLLATFLVVQGAIAEQISIQYYSGSNVIYSGMTGNVTFQVTSSGLGGTLYYGFASQIDGGSWSGVTNIGFVSGTHIDYLTVSLGDGGHTIAVRLVYWDGFASWVILANSSANYTMYYGVTVQNSYVGGSITVDGNSYSSGQIFQWHNGQNHTLTATDNVTYGGILRIFDSWSGPGLSGSGTTVTATIGGPATYSAGFHNRYQVSFQNSYPGYGNGGVINVNSTQYNSPASPFWVDEGNSITGGVVSTSQVISYVEYTFTSWSPGGSTSASTQFSPTGNTTYNANFSAKPQAPTNLQQVASVNEHVHLTWSDNPNSVVNVVNIYRHEVGQSRSLVASIGRGGSWIDPYVIVKGPKDGPEFIYEICSYFTGATESDYVQINQFGEELGVRVDAKVVGEEGALGMPKECSVGNYPNPFNPSTTISYSLPENSSVKLDVFDVAGRQVRILVDEFKSAGYHNVVWNGKDENGRGSASGMYVYRFTATPVSGDKAFTRSGKLVLTK